MRPIRRCSTPFPEYFEIIWGWSIMLNVIIDLSHHNETVDFATLKAAGIVGIIHKATQGTGYTDPTYASRRTDAEAAGLLWGAYHFGTGADGAVQAKQFLKVAGPPDKTLLVLDFEQNTQGDSMTLAQADDFVTAVQQQSGRWPVLYTGSSYFGTKKDALLAKCPLWLAQYGSKTVVPANWPSWTLWQYTDGISGPGPHTVDGVGKCDRDQFYGTLEQLMAFWPGAATPTV